MMSERMADAINEQINAEFYSAFLYLSMATKLEDMTLPGHANWMRVQYEEEVFHAMKFLAIVGDEPITAMPPPSPSVALE